MNWTRTNWARWFRRRVCRFRDHFGVLQDPILTHARVNTVTAIRYYRNVLIRRIVQVLRAYGTNDVRSSRVLEIRYVDVEDSQVYR